MADLDESLEAIENAIGDRIDGKRLEASRWRTTREEAAEREQTILKEVAELELAINVLRRLLGKPSQNELFGGLDMMRFRSQTVADSCFEIMAAKGGRAKVTDIIDILIEAGKLKDDRRIAYSTAVKSMDRDERFVKVGRGEYGPADNASHAGSESDD